MIPSIPASDDAGAGLLKKVSADLGAGVVTGGGGWQQEATQDIIRPTGRRCQQNNADVMGNLRTGGQPERGPLRKRPQVRVSERGEPKQTRVSEAIERRQRRTAVCRICGSKCARASASRTTCSAACGEARMDWGPLMATSLQLFAFRNSTRRHEGQHCVKVFVYFGF